jgi:hypothetical protein
MQAALSAPSRPTFLEQGLGDQQGAALPCSS